MYIVLSRYSLDALNNANVRQLVLKKTMTLIDSSLSRHQTTSL